MYHILENQVKISWKKIKNLYWSFINKKATISRVRYTTCYKKKREGGINAVNIDAKINANLASWITILKTEKEEHLWKTILNKYIKKGNKTNSKIINDILKSWKRINKNNKEDIIVKKNKTIKIKKTKVKDLYQSIINKKEEEIIPKDNQNLTNLKQSFKWLNKTSFNNKTKETCWKLLHRKLYTNERDGGIKIIFENELANKIWDKINQTWKIWTKENLNTEHNQIFNFNKKYSYEENTLKAITIREIYRSNCNERLNKIDNNYQISLNRIYNELKLCLMVVLDRCPQLAKSALSLDNTWLDYEVNSIICYI